MSRDEAEARNAGPLAGIRILEFEAIGPGRSTASRQSSLTPRHHRRHHANIGGIIRHFMAMVP